MKLSTLGRCMAVLLVLAGIALASRIAPAFGDSDPGASSDAYLSKTGATLDLLLQLSESPEQVVGDDTFASQVNAIAETGVIEVSIRFREIPELPAIRALEGRQVRFIYLDGEIAHSGTVFGAMVPLEVIDDIAASADIVRIESIWQPGVHSPLDTSIVEINADDVWAQRDGNGNRVMGQGVTIANFDTGIDVFHPDFFNADGGTYAWLDSNGNGVFDAGVDAVDLDSDGNAAPDELLDILKATSHPDYGRGYVPGTYRGGGYQSGRLVVQ
ncbi:MAG: hypothetical protein U9R25_13410 [Chloroflexota bacterium]|nr:hypothetical protein [Chloroflexota bacterium]